MSRENKEMKAQQAKSSVDQGKGVKCDKTIKNKAERDRYEIDLQVSYYDSVTMASFSVWLGKLLS